MAPLEKHVISEIELAEKRNFRRPRGWWTLRLQSFLPKKESISLNTGFLLSSYSDQRQSNAEFWIPWSDVYAALFNQNLPKITLFSFRSCQDTQELLMEVGKSWNNGEKWKQRFTRENRWAISFIFSCKLSFTFSHHFNLGPPPLSAKCLQLPVTIQINMTLETAQ